MIGKDVRLAAQLLKEGKLVAIPTETVYGLAANALSESAVRKIYEAKGRPSFNPLIIHLADISQLSEYAREIPQSAYELLNRFSPGPLTLILPKKEVVPDIVTAGLDSVAVRIPAHPVLRELLKICGLPLAAPSANPSGYISPTSAQHVEKMLGGKVDYILDGGTCSAGLESTIVGFPNGVPAIYREGIISRTEIEKIIGPVELNVSGKIHAPGMLSSHYSPNTPLILTDNVPGEIEKNKNKKIGLITYGSLLVGLPENQQILLCDDNEFELAARNLYAAMHEMDERGYDLIIARRFPYSGIGVAINDRLERAAVKD